MTETADYTMEQFENMTDRDIEILMEREKTKAHKALMQAAQNFYQISRLYNIQKMPLTEKSYKKGRVSIMTYANQL